MAPHWRQFGLLLDLPRRDDSNGCRDGIQTGDTDPYGVEISADSLQLNDGTIHDRAGNAAHLTLQPLAADPRHTV
ncbi:MAG: hypothetical protein OXD34_10705 [bacterium]|nr:hypothetical protein [bacterium]